MSSRVRSLLPPRVATVSEVWRAGHPWATIYDYVVEHEQLGRALWQTFMGSDLRLLYRAADRIAALPDGAAVLDVPCGGGVALRGLRREQRIRYVAADIAPYMLERTSQRVRRLGLEQVEMVQADIESLPFEDGAFDLTVSFTGLHCVPHPALAVREIARCLRPGGELTGSAFLNDTGARFEPMRAIGRASGLLGPSGSVRDLRSWLVGAGLVGAVLQRSGGLVYFTAVRA
jgi:ubiquinone/menaquinone biosynthesis C-methylase UbiE